ncbi:MFS transporter [Kitasatospora sp. SUK 42]|uniref:MFS transporter n=1 Tax=Kitasatospora sp. SUK 42 TaxID=1588882 RepID=UPI0018C8E597|nr:MFS transporter [Kitasatospora sp. SUK 42]MBV2155382.1 MFS transporter [Kitasatospora sp. SUK 42]
MSLTAPAVARTSAEVRRAYWGTAAAFLFNGLLISVWFTRIPSIKENTHLTAGALGSVLMVSVIGGLVSMRAAVRLIGTFGSSTVIRLALLAEAGMLWAAALAHNGVQLALALLLFGLADGLLNVGMNVQGVAVERRSGRPCLSVFHASWSIGALAAAVLSMGFTWAEWSVSSHFLVVAALSAVLSVPLLRGLLSADTERADTEQADTEHKDAPSADGPAGGRGRWSRKVVLLGGLGLCCLVAQGAIEDWGAVFITEDQHGSRFTATIGFTAFSATVTIGRLVGDRLRERFETTRLLRVFAALGVVGLTVSLVTPVSAVTVVGFALFGWGMSILDPVISSAAGHSAGGGEKETAAAVSQVSTLGHAGFLLGPPAIGWLTELVGLRASLVIPGVLILIVGTGAAFIARMFPAAVAK